MFSASHFFSGKYFSKHQQVCESKKKTSVMLLLLLNVTALENRKSIQWSH